MSSGGPKVLYLRCQGCAKAGFHPGTLMCPSVSGAHTGSGPDRKTQILSRSENTDMIPNVNADLVPIGKCGSGPDRK